MGCRHSKRKTFVNLQRSSDSVEPGTNMIVGEVMKEEDEEVEVSPEQKELIEETWKLLVDNISNVGVITFMNLFETHPDVQEVFMPFAGLSAEELRHSKELRAHGLRVMGFVQKVVARLGQPHKARQLLQELGRNHVMYGAKIDYVDLIGPQFVFAVKPSLQEQWSEDIEEAWMQLFCFMAHVMKAAMLEANTVT